MTTENTLKEQVDAILGKLKILITYGGESRDKGWPHDRWNVSIMAGKEEHNIPYKTGLGLRKSYYDRKGIKTPREAYGMAAKKKPQTPSLVDIFHALTLDGQAFNESFSDWCDNYGYSNDSIDALNTYKACEDTGKLMRKLFTPSESAILEEFYQNY